MGGSGQRVKKVGKECKFVGKGVISLGKEILFKFYSDFCTLVVTTATLPPRRAMRAILVKCDLNESFHHELSQV